MLLQLVFVRRRPSSCVNNWTFVTSSKPHHQWLPILFKFGMMHFRDKGNINCKFHDYCPTGALGASQSGQNLTLFRKSPSLLSHIWKKYWIQSYVDQVALYQKFKFYAPEVGFLTLGRDWNGHVVFMHIMFKNLFLYFSAETIMKLTACLKRPQSPLLKL